MTKKGREFNEIYDLTAMRVIVDSVKDCYGAIGVIHAIWKPLPGRFKDMIATPKLNLYQALHTTVIGPSGQPLEIQIRTPEMHELAEYGIAAHVIYKEGAGKGKEAGRDKMTWLRHLLDEEGEGDPSEFLEALKVDLFEDEVFVFTPKGEIKNLSAGSTPLDFAYAVHTDVGHRCVGAKVNGKIVPLHYQLKSGDIVEILTGKRERGPSRDWLGLVRTSRARNKIRAFLKSERREDAEKTGREHPQRVAAQARPAAAADRRFTAARRRDPRDRLPQGDDFYIALGQGKITAGTVTNKLMQRLKQGEAVAGDETESRLGERARRARRARAPDPGRDRLRDQRQGRRRRHGPAREVLPAGSRRRDRRLRLARPRDHDPSRRLQERRGAVEVAGALHRGLLGRRQPHLLPGRDRDRCLGPDPPP